VRFRELADAAACRLSRYWSKMSGKTARRKRSGRGVPPPPRAAGTGRGGLSRPWLYGGLAVVVIAAVVGVVLASQLGGGGGAGAASTAQPAGTVAGADGAASTAQPATVAGAERTAALLDGIPQDGMALGSPDAPVTLVEYADVQCPFCGQWSYDAFPAIVDEYVRTGKVRIVFSGMAFLGPESELGLRAVLAAGRQDRSWNVLHLLFENQGQENSGWLTDGLLRELGRSVAGLDTTAMMAAAGSEAVGAELANAAGAAETAGIHSTPSFQVGLTGGTLERLKVSDLTADAMRPALDALLAG
jgi:protein-disulfide isomerase